MSDETMRIDFTGVEGQKSFDPLPAGRYTVEVTDYKLGKASENAKNPGATTISWTLEVIENDDESLIGRKVWENMTIVGASLWRLKAFMVACGFEVEDGEFDFNPEEIVGSTLDVKLAIQKGRKNPATGEEYDPRNTVKAFYESAGSVNP